MEPRLALIELVPSDPTRNYRSDYFPFMSGYLKERGVPVSWSSLGVEVIPASSGRNQYIYDLSPGDRTALCRALGEFAPTHVLTNERLEDDLFSELRGAAPEASFRMFEFVDSPRVAELLGGWLGVDTSDLEDEVLFEDQVAPDFGKVALNRAARSVRPYIRLKVGPECTYHRGLGTNPHYAGFGGDEEVISFGGCTFCQRPDPKQFGRLRSSPPSLAVRQVQAWERTGSTDLQDREYLAYGAGLFRQIGRFFDELIDAGVPASTFHFSCRMDEFLAREDDLRLLLPRIREAGHAIHLSNIAVENFSDVENERFNKGLDTSIIRGCLSVSEELRQRYPDNFRCDSNSGFGFILFTPWTRLEDLRINLECFRRYRFVEQGCFLGTSLQLLPGLPITRLAEADGLLTERFEDYPWDSGCFTSWEHWELPWRFRHPEAATAFYIIRRTTADAADIIPEEDRSLQLIRTWLERTEEALPDRYALFEAVIHVLEARPGLRSVLSVLARVEQNLNIRSGLDLEGFAVDDGQREEGIEQLQQALAREQARADEGVSFWTMLAETVSWNHEHNPKVRQLLRGLRIEQVRAGDRDDLSLETSVQIGDGLLPVIVREDDRETPRLLSDGPLILYYSGADHDLSPQDRDRLRRYLRLVRRAYEKLRQEDVRPTPAAH